MKRSHLIGLAGLGSLALFLAALAFEYIGELLPCALCLWQRWPHRVAIVLALIGVVFPRAVIAWLGAASMLVNAGISLMHTGVERAWWDGPQVCGASAAQDLGSLSVEDLFDTTSGPQLILCNEAAWHFLGLSMASWNGLACLVLAAIWIAAARRPA
ncbi:disulfide bond formation protein B [Gymnodinialimonas sp. 2305UL16-5]|uniref:disulfide bond formation protein B n=1 Tax=Gymnodinialimonas mytili TaxID=3126503 RepID=UPI00309723D1